MIASQFDYVRPRTVAAALKALDAPESKVIAGGQSLFPLLRFRLAQPERLVDIGRIAALRGVRRQAGGLRIGAATTYTELLSSPAVRRYSVMLAELLEHVGDVQVRNVGTMGGSLAHADPASDVPAALLALNASFQLQSKSGKRSVAAADFFQGPFTTAMESGELLTDIFLPALPRKAGSAYVSFDQKASGFALVGAAAVIGRTERGGPISHATLAFTGIAEVPTLARAADRLVGSSGDPALLAEVARDAVGAMQRINDDIHAPAAYRRHLGTVAASRALGIALNRAK
jgi:carbon-monoxide dehydrogenase medium subunit